MRRRNEDGSVLILSVWILVMLFCLALSLSYRARIGLRLARYEWDEIRLIQAAKIAARGGVSFWRKNGVSHAALNEPYVLEDECARINLNKASAEVLGRLFGIHAEVVPDILQWRSPAPGVDGYSGLGYICRHAPFKSVDELLLVKGITPEIFRDARDNLTVDTDGQININTASARVLESAGLPPTLAGKILNFRAADGVFDQTGSILARLTAATFLGDQERRSLTGALHARMFTVQSDDVRLHILVGLPDGPAKRGVDVVVSGRAASAVRILQWRELYR